MINNNFAFVFPGQGSQTVGMLEPIATVFPEICQTYDEASSVLGYDLTKLINEGPSEILDQTQYTQPALLAASFAIWRILKDRMTFPPTQLAGHSLGEYTALVCAEALSFSDGLKLVAARGLYMQEATPKGVGAMAAIIGLDEEKVATICKDSVISATEVLSPANFNSVGQIVIAGHKEVVLRAIQMAKDEGAKLATLIPVSVPSHCLLMKPAADRLQELLQTIPIYSPKIPVLSNVDVKLYADAQSIREGLVKQLCMPVRWVSTIEQFMTSGITHIIECGPGKILTGLNKRIDKNLQLMTTSDLESLEAVIKFVSSDQVASSSKRSA